MTKTIQPAYKTRRDGSIDYAHYLNRSAELRSQDFRAAFAALWRLFFGRRDDDRAAPMAVATAQGQRAVRTSARKVVAPTRANRSAPAKRRG